jgi:hypothetical protein
VDVILNTPAEVYAESSTFIARRELVPVLGQPYNYKVRFNTKVKQDRNGRNFHSDLFVLDGNITCFMEDDGSGKILLIEQIEPGNTQVLKTVGTLKYESGDIEVTQLWIQEKIDNQLFFYVESLDEIVPTSTYFAEQNSLVVQSSTVTFPTGEQVEISQYEKATELVELSIFVKSQDRNTITNEISNIRTAIYKLVILPDYDSGKERLLQAITEEV